MKTKVVNPKLFSIFSTLSASLKPSCCIAQLTGHMPITIIAFKQISTIGLISYRVTLLVSWSIVMFIMVNVFSQTMSPPPS